MPISPGARLGSYEVLSPLGAGGMGEVYKARDTRLDRTVAIKVLPSHLADKPQLRERFEREARAVSSLNHPHICTLYDIGQQDGTHYLVMEYLEGETLAQRLDKGPLPLDQVLRYAIEIADALDKAHRQGVTHRDLKPGNIMLTKAGTKLLDFGLAKLKQQAAPDNVPFSQLPTAKDSLTVEGTILGTLQYMAPEQVEGKVDEIDARTDIFAFGTVVYEMATGKKAFEGKSQASLIAKILETDPPPMSSLQPMTPTALDRVVKKCLAKEPEARWQSARDLHDELQWIKEGGQEPAKASFPEAKLAPTGWRRALPWAVAVVLSIAVGVGGWVLKPTSPQPVSRVAINLPPGQTLAALDHPAIVISPDGKDVVYVAEEGGTQQLYLRPLDSQESNPIAGTEGAVAPFFSPDGQWVGFFAGANLKKVSVNGGPAVTLASAQTPRGASWSSQGTLAFQAIPSAGQPLQQVSAEGGTPEPLGKGGMGLYVTGWPEFLPGGAALLFANSQGLTAWNNAQILVQPVGGDEYKNLALSGTQPRYAATGHLLYAQSGTLMAASFDAQRLTLGGASVPVLDGVMQSAVTGATQYSVSSWGTLVYLEGAAGGGQSELVWVSRNGEEQSLSVAPSNFTFTRVSHDGRRIAVSVVEEGTQVWIYDASRGALSRLTFEGNINSNPTWSPDGERIAFSSNQADEMNDLYWQASDGSGGAERLRTSESRSFPSSFSPDGQLLAFIEINPETGRDIWVLNLSDREAEPFLRTPYEDTAPKFSPDGKWLAYSSDESGRREIYVQPYPGPGGKWLISTDGGQEPVWNPNGGELFYRSGNKMMAVDIDTTSPFAAGRPGCFSKDPTCRRPPVLPFTMSAPTASVS